nr:hypothetical protein HmN_000378400 [Hymenolepis microstoma]
MRELFQCGKPLPIEDLCGEDDASHSSALTPERPPPSKINSRTPSFLSDLKGESAVQRRLQNAINESNGDADDIPPMKDLAASLVRELNSNSSVSHSPSTGISKSISCQVQSSPPPIPARPKKCPPLRSFNSSFAQEEKKVQLTSGAMAPTNGEMPKTAPGSSEVSLPTTCSHNHSKEIDRAIYSAECEVVKPPNTVELVANAAIIEEEYISNEEEEEEGDSECSDEVEQEDDNEEESSAEETADWDPIDPNADKSKLERFSLPSYLRPVAVNDAGVYLLEDGHFFYQTDGIKPLPDSQKRSSSPQAEENGTLEESNSNVEGSPSPSKKRKSVNFSIEPITVFSTHSVTAYRRRNEAIDPLVASAEYELEKRLEDLDLIEVELNKGNLIDCGIISTWFP